MNKTFAEKVIDFNKNLEYKGSLPPGFRVLNPYTSNPETMKVMEEFYNKYYKDTKKRKFIVGINPGRHGAAVTGVPFTDTKRLETVCGIKMHSAHTHEISSVFIYDLIAAYGGAEKFYKAFYINSPFPLAIIRKKANNWINANYYDDPHLFEMVKGFMIKCLCEHLAMGLNPTEIYILGKKNATFIERLNTEYPLFGGIKILDHPRYIQQYKSKDKAHYIEKYIATISAED